MTQIGRILNVSTTTVFTTTKTVVVKSSAHLTRTYFSFSNFSKSAFSLSLWQASVRKERLVPCLRPFVDRQDDSLYCPSDFPPSRHCCFPSETYYSQSPSSVPSRTRFASSSPTSRQRSSASCRLTDVTS